MVRKDYDPIVETKRLILRPFLIGDAKCFYHLNKDPIVMKYTGDKCFEDIAQSEAFIRQYDHYQQVGYGRWTVLRKSDMIQLGWCGLKYHPNEDYTDLGYRYLTKYWNQGYATEAARGCLARGFEELGLIEVVGRTSQKNIASIKVLEKVGMKYWKKAPCEGIKDSVFYKISAKEWKSRT